MTAPAPIHVYVVDDHPVVRAGLTAIFAEYPEIVVAGAASDAATALREIRELRPAVAVVDVRLHGQDGCDLCARIKTLPHPPRVLMLTAFGEEDNVLAAVGAGADGFLLKDSRDEVLVAAITMVAAGGSVWPPLAARVLRQSLPRGERPLPNPLDALSPQERRVLSQIAEGKTNKEIAAQFGVAEKTVRNQTSHLMRKLGVERRAQAAACFVKHHHR